MGALVLQSGSEDRLGEGPLRADMVSLAVLPFQMMLMHHEELRLTK
jgi:hypothetical protein